MNEFVTEGEPSGPLHTVSLGQLRDLPLEERCASLLFHDHRSFEIALQKFKQFGEPLCVDAHRLAWAIAFNIEGLAEAVADFSTVRRGSFFRRKGWNLNTQWNVIWSVLIKPVGTADSQEHPTLLSELALSVACEQREDWQHPLARPVNLALADRMFDFVYNQNRLKVLGVCLTYANRVGDPEDIAKDAWSMMFSTYWSIRATQRFQGFARISTLVCQIARYLAVNEYRNQARFVTFDESPSDDVANVVGLGSGPIFDPTSRLISDQLYRRAEECLGSLPAKRRIVAQMVWLRQIQANRVAQILRVSEAAVSQHLKLARVVVSNCLNKHGFRLSS